MLIKNAKLWVVVISVAMFAMMFSLASFAQGSSSCQPSRGTAGLSKLTPLPDPSPGYVDPCFQVTETPDVGHGMNGSAPAGDQTASGMVSTPDIFTRMQIALTNLMHRLFPASRKNTR